MPGDVCFVGAGPRACPAPGQPQGVAPTSALEEVYQSCVV